MTSKTILLFFLFASFCSPVFASMETGTSPALMVQDIEGQTFDLSRLRDNVVIIHFWATWCPGCLTEMPELDSFYRHNKDKNIKILAISLDRPRQLDKVKKMMRRFSYKTAMLSEAQVNDFGAPQAIPVTYIIDRDGRVSDVMTPDIKPVNEKNLDAVILPLLQNPNAVVPGHSAN